MSGKRKFSESFHNDTDVVQTLMKYRTTSSNGPAVATRTPCPTVSQNDLKTMLDNFVIVYESLDPDNSVNKKPNFSYTELIFLSIMRSPNFCLPISEIYRYIETRFRFFKHTKKEHWKNAIRHSLSKTRCFTKIGLDNQKPRNGILNRSAFLWTIMPKSLLNFARGDYRPSNKLSGSNAVRSGFQQLKADGMWDGCVVALTNITEAFRNILNSSPCPAKMFQLQVCNLTDTNCFSADAVDNPMPLNSPPFYVDCTKNVAHTLWSPENTSAISSLDIFCPSSITNLASPPNERNCESFYSSSPSDSGYDTMGDLSSPEHGSTGFYSRMSPLLSPSYSGHSNQMIDTIPGIDPAVLFNIPTIPELPSFQDLSTEEDNRLRSLPCIVEDNEIAEKFDEVCCCASNSSIGFLSDLTISFEDRTILQEFLLL